MGPQMYNSSRARLLLWRLSYALALLLSLLLVCFHLDADAKESQASVDAQMFEVPGWNGVQLGISKTQVKGKRPYISYVLSGGGLKDHLSLGEEPQEHLKRCVAGDYPDRSFRSVQPVKTQRGDCLKLLVLWGDFLVEGPLGQRLEAEDAEKERGWRFLQQGFLLLLEDLKRISDVQERLERMQSVRHLDFRVAHVMVMSKFPNVVRTAALNYYSYVWNALPQISETYAAFMLKFATGEHLKELYSGAVIDDKPVDQTLAVNALRFYEQAKHFHQAPMPDAQRTEARPPRVVLAKLRYPIP